jgi:S1-C subfamily serine protease
MTRMGKILGMGFFWWRRSAGLLLVAALAMTTMSAAARAQQQPSLEDMLSGIVRIKTFIDPDGKTVANLGSTRDGSGIVIDHDGLVLTIGYLMVEAQRADILTNDGRTVPANVLGYDHTTGFGLLKAVTPLKVTPFTIGKSAELKERDPVLAASYGGRAGLAPAYVVSRREFAGSWEYLIDSAIYTAPAHSHWSGAALINRDGKLVGVGSLILRDVSGAGTGPAGNMYVPIDLLSPVLADLISDKPAAGSNRPWLGLSTEQLHGRLFVSRLTPGGPAEKAGLQRGDIIVGVNGEPPQDLADFYRKIWAQGDAGVPVPLDVLQGNETRRIEIRSMNRLDHLKLKSTF